ncbi:hypothetical protein BMETH_36401771860, partial [methanotrophic bacterial endosymbiont of Bathymodiolus sp.]
REYPVINVNNSVIVLRYYVKHICY